MSKNVIAFIFKMSFIRLFAIFTLLFSPMIAQASTPIATDNMASSTGAVPSDTNTALQKNALQTPAKNLSPMQQLQLMQTNHSTTDYGLFFVNITPASIESFRYYHAYADNNNYAQLTTMDGIQQEILQRGDIISYFSPLYPSFSIRGNYIIDNFPSILWANLKSVNKYYDIIPVGMNRIADHVVNTLRIVPKDGYRDQLVLFLNAKNHMLLRQDVLDHNGNLLSQFRVVDFIPLTNVKKFIAALDTLDMPPFITTKMQTSQNTFAWKLDWLPKGFHLIKQTVNTLNGKTIETQFYSDGIFSFTINVAPSIIPDAPDKSWSRGALSLYTRTQNNQDFTCIGEIPVSTAKRIIENIKSN